MENTLKLSPVSDRDIFYYQRRNQNRLFEALTSFFADEAERRGISKKDISESIRRDPASITRLLSTPSNVTADTVSAFLLSLEAEMDYRIVRFSERAPVNEMHPLIARVTQPDITIKYNTKYQVLTPMKSSVPVIEARSQ
jgi:hypothetical protein